VTLQIAIRECGAVSIADLQGKSTIGEGSEQFLYPGAVVSFFRHIRYPVNARKG
jgi:hypothetical protein